MSHTPDMELLDEERRWYAVGWLHPDHPFPTALAAPEFVERLNAFVERGGDGPRVLQLGYRMGFHTCEFCDRSDATGYVIVPATDRLFYAPKMIAHYVEAHDYAPPSEFVAAVMQCPAPGTGEYLRAVAAYR